MSSSELLARFSSEQIGVICGELRHCSSDREISIVLAKLRFYEVLARQSGAIRKVNDLMNQQSESDFNNTVRESLQSSLDAGRELLRLLTRITGPAVGKCYRETEEFVQKLENYLQDKRMS